jgi:hypothetical protein
MTYSSFQRSVQTLYTVYHVRLQVGINESLNGVCSLTRPISTESASMWRLESLTLAIGA